MAYPFAAAEVLTAVDLNAMIGAPTQNTQTGTTYTFGLADAGKVNTFDNASPVTATLPAQATVSWPANTVLPVLCLGAGTVTITPAAGVTINGTPLTLATSKGGSLVRTASNTWTFTPSGGGGKVLQVVSVTKVDTFTTTSTSFTDVTGLTANITPSATSSKILVLHKTSINVRSALSVGSLQLLREATVIGGGTAAGSRRSAMSTFYVNQTSSTGDLAGNYLDSPSSTSEQTYKIQVIVQTGTVGINTSGSDNDNAQSARNSSTITLMEIGA